MLQPSLGALGAGRVWRGGWERRALLGAWRTSGNLGLVVSNSSSSSPLPSGRPWLCGPGVLGAQGGVGSTWCARGSHRWKQHKSVPWGGSKRQGTPSPRSGLSWVLPRLSFHSFSKPPGIPIPSPAGGNLDVTARPSPFLPCGHDKGPGSCGVEPL